MEDNFYNKVNKETSGSVNSGGANSLTDSDSLYLSKLEFAEKDGNNWMAYLIKKIRIVAVIILSLFIWGGVSLMALPLESDPEVEIPVGLVSIALPGASPADVEELVIKKIEPAIINLSGIDSVSATAFNSFASITVEFGAKEDLDDSIRRLRDAIDSAKNELPAEAGDPMVRQIAISEIPVWTIVVAGSYDNFTLRSYADIVKEALENLEGTSRVMLSGGDVSEIRIDFDSARLERYGITMDQALGVVRANNLGIPLGTIDISSYRYSLTADGKLHDAKDVRNLPITAVDGNIIRLKDVADVVEKAQKREVLSKFSLEGNEPGNAISLNIVKKPGSSIVKLIDDGKAEIEKLKDGRIPKDLEVVSTLDFSQDIRDNIRDLVRSGVSTVLLVVFVLFLFVGFKEAFVAGLAIPMVFAATFGVMNLMGVSLNYLSLFSLILSLGILVDNAIVVLQASKQYIRTGKFTPEEAVLLVFRDFKYTLITTTLTTVWAFIPLLLATGIVGQYIRSIPITVSATLMASLFIAFFVNHPLAVFLERYRFGNKEQMIQEAADDEKIKARMREKYSEVEVDGDGGHSGGRMRKKFFTGIIKLERVLPLYERMLNRLMGNRILTFAYLLTVGLLFAGAVYLPASGILKAEFLGQADFEYLYVNVEGSAGLLAEEMSETIDEITDILMKEKAVSNFSVTTGSSGVNMSSFSSVAQNNTNRAQFAIQLYPLEIRAEKEGLNKPSKSYVFAGQLREKLAYIKDLKVKVQEISGGPPAGADFEARISGEDLGVLEKLAEKYKTALENIPGTVNEETSIAYNPGEFTITFDYDQMLLRGLTVAQVAPALRTAISGAEITKILGDGDDLKVTAGFKENEGASGFEGVATIEGVKSLTLADGRGGTYRLEDIADIELGSSLTSIYRIDKKRVVGISANVEPPRLASEILADFQKYADENPLPEGYFFDFGGVNEQTNESIVSIFNAMNVALMLIIATLILQLNSFRKIFIVLATIPLACTGVFYGLLAFGMTLSFPVLIGVLALFGIVINNAIILVVKIDTNIQSGIKFKESIIDASKMRLEAIFLTSICTIIGMMPLALTSEIWGGLGTSLIFGLGASTFLTLFTIPVLYNLLMKKSCLREERIRRLQQN